MQYRLTLFLFCCAIGWPISQLQAQQLWQQATITTISGQTIRGWAKVDAAETYHHHLAFRIGRSGNGKVYRPEELEAFQLNEGVRYKSTIIPEMAKGNILTGQQKHCFLRVLCTGDYNFYIYQPGGRNQFFYISDANGRISPLHKKKVSIEAQRVADSDKYILPSGERVINPTGGIFTTNNGTHYYYDGFQMYVLQNTYVSQLNTLIQQSQCSMIRLDHRFPLTANALKNFSKTLHACTKSNNYEVDKKQPIHQVALLANASLWHNGGDYNDLKQGLGLTLEYRQNSLSPSVTFSFRYQNITDGWQSLAQSGDPRSSFLMLTSGEHYMGSLGYHFLPGHVIRPFFQLGAYFSRYDLVPGGTDSNGNEFLLNLGSTQTSGNLFAALGCDFYFLRFNQIRIEANYAEGYSLGAAYGLYFSF